MVITLFTSSYALAQQSRDLQAMRTQNIGTKNVPERLLKTKVRFEYTQLIESKSYFKYEDDYTNLVQRCEVCDVSSKSKFVNLKGILPQKIFYRPNLIFWIAMGCGKARFGWKGQKTPKIENFGLKVFLMCELPRGPRKQTLRPKLSILGVFRLFRPKRASPHPIAIQNMRFWRQIFFCGTIPFIEFVGSSSVFSHCNLYHLYFKYSLQITLKT